MSKKLFTVFAAMFACAFAAVSADLTGSDAALFDQPVDWVVEYSAENGMPGADWKCTIPAARRSIVERDGEKALRVQNVNPTETSKVASGLYTYADPKAFAKLTGTVLVEIEVAFPEELKEDKKAHHQFYFRYSSGNDPITDLIACVNVANTWGTFGACNYPAIPYGKFVKVRMAMDTATGTQALWINGKKFFKANAKPLDKKKNLLYFGDGGEAINGVFELKSLKVGAIK